MLSLCESCFQKRLSLFDIVCIFLDKKILATILVDFSDTLLCFAYFLVVFQIFLFYLSSFNFYGGVSEQIKKY